MRVQTLIMTLDGITAGDYLAWVRDPEPPALGLSLRSVTVRADPLSDTIEAVLAWNACPPAPHIAGPVAGLPLTAEVVAVESRELAAAA